MCLGCWENEGKPFELTYVVKMWAPKFAEASSGGVLHIVVEDWNLDDENIDFCLAQPDITPEEKDFAETLKRMREGERWATAILSCWPDFDPAKELDQ